MATIPTGLNFDRSKITVLPADNPNKKRLGFRVFESPPIIINDFAIATITIPSIEKPEILVIPKYDDIYTPIERRFEILDL